MRHIWAVADKWSKLDLSFRSFEKTPKKQKRHYTKSAIPQKILHLSNSCAACAANELPVKSQSTVCSFNPQSPTVAPLQRNNPQPTGVSLISSRIQWANATTKARGSGEQGSMHGFQLFWVNTIFMVPLPYRCRPTLLPAWRKPRVSTVGQRRGHTLHWQSCVFLCDFFIFF